MNIALIFVAELTSLISYGNNIFNTLNLALDTIQPVCMLWCGIMGMSWIAFGLAHKYMSLGVDTNHNDIIYRPILTLVALSMYRELCQLLITTPGKFMYEIALASPVTGGFCGSPLGMLPQSMFNNVAIQILMVFHLFTIVITQIAGGYIILRSIVALCAFYIIGPFAFVMSLMTKNTQIIRRWYLYMLNYKMWPVVLVLILTVNDALLALSEPTVQNQTLSFFVSILLRFVVVASIIDIPRFASHMITAASGFITTEADDWVLGKAQWIMGSPFRMLLNRFTGGVYGKLIKKGQGKI